MYYNYDEIHLPTYLTELNRGLQRLSLKTEALTEFCQVKPRFDKLTKVKSKVNREKPRITNNNT